MDVNQEIKLAETKFCTHLYNITPITKPASTDVATTAQTMMVVVCAVIRIKRLKNKNNTFKYLHGKENIHKKEDGSDCTASVNESIQI